MSLLRRPDTECILNAYRWNYAQEHNVQLPDEYDQIYHDLEPYWGLDPIELRAAQRESEDEPDSFTIGKEFKESPIHVLKAALPPSTAEQMLHWGAEPQIELLEDIQHLLPPFRAVFSPHDGASQRFDWVLRESMLEAAASGTCEHLPMT